MDEETKQQVASQISDIVEATALALETTLESGLYATVAKAQHKYLEALLDAGFTEEQAMQILASHNILQAHGT